MTSDGSSKSKTTITLNSLLPDESVEMLNDKILNNQLNHCRFMYYLIRNSHHIPLPDDSVKRITLIIFKHLIKTIKELSDSKTNFFKLANWDTYKQSSKYKSLILNLQEYCEKYEK